MLLTEKIKEFREDRSMVQCQFAAALEIETPMYSKIERGNRRVNREQIPVIAHLLQIDEKELVMLWLAYKFIATIAVEKELASQAFKIALQKCK
jgi:transcriptional regulator with XRE-family HTH domain